jgi:hypothetical protein
MGIQDDLPAIKIEIGVIHAIVSQATTIVTVLLAMVAIAADAIESDLS